jgi:hypothetical protein
MKKPVGGLSPAMTGEHAHMVCTTVWSWTVGWWCHDLFWALAHVGWGSGLNGTDFTPFTGHGDEQMGCLGAASLGHFYASGSSLESMLSIQPVASIMVGMLLCKDLSQRIGGTNSVQACGACCCSLRYNQPQ